MIGFERLMVFVNVLKVVIVLILIWLYAQIKLIATIALAIVNVFGLIKMLEYHANVCFLIFKYSTGIIRCHVNVQVKKTIPLFSYIKINVLLVMKDVHVMKMVVINVMLYHLFLN
jgi:hypothetical protein